ncbi:right-handed parallel beta-helix repeat-containing protein [Hirschia litorea]|uniref:Right-handed parallel beta-helix repeat-containing protein n=1 Tax=Hirschia litorea TaxID=1199156 RepID=A0ABW2IPF8_9PROT
MTKMDVSTGLNRRQFSVLGVAASGVMLAGCDDEKEEPVKKVDGFSAQSREDATPALVAAIKHAVANNLSQIDLPAGELHFWPDAGEEKFLNISNNDSRDFKIAGLLDGISDLTIKGQGTSLVFHGLVVPFSIQNASNIKFENLSIDWEVPFHLEGKVEAVDQVDGRWIEITIPEEFSYRLEDGKLVFVGEDFEQEGLKRILEFDATRKETAYKVWDNGFMARDHSNVRPHIIEEIAPRRLKISVQDAGFKSLPSVGNVVIMQPSNRWAPAFFVEDSKNVTFRNVTIYHAGCMGIIAQTSEDITLDGLNVLPSGDRYVSTCVDATHFVNCSGTISVENGDFSNHIDDAVNVHGIYLRVLEADGANAFKAELAEFQQHGVRPVREGDFISLADAKGVDVYYTSRVKSAVYESRTMVRIELDRDVPAQLADGDVVNILNRQANLVIRGNKIGQNRARGILISTAGTVLVEDNKFHAPGSAIRISGGVDHWYEAGPTSQIMIRKNEFNHCLYGVWGQSIIDIICVDSEESQSETPFHDTVIIKDNLFRTEHGDFITAYRVGTLMFEGNQIIVEPYQKADAQTKTPFDLKAVGKFVLKDNQVEGYNWPIFDQT